MDPTTLNLIVVAFLIAGAIKGALGVGLPTTAIAILGAGLDLRAAIPLLIVPSLAANIWQTMRGGGLLDLLRRFWLLNATACLGIWLGTMILFRIDSAFFPALLGIVVALYAGMGLCAIAPKIPPRREATLTPIIGLGAGLLTGTTGSLLMPMMVYLQALDLGKDRFIQAAGLSLLIGTIVWAAALAGQGALDIQTIGYSAFALAPTVAGMGIGHWIRNRLSQSLFRKVVYLFLLVLGLNLIRGAVF